MVEHITTESGEQSNDSTRWGKFPLWWLPVLRMKRNALAVAVALSCHADKDGRAWPDAETIANETGVRRDRVFAAVKDLRDAGIIVKSERRYRKPTYHWLQYGVPEGGTPDNGTTAEVEYRKPGDWSTDPGCSGVPEARSEIRSSIRSINRSRSIDGLKKINLTIDEGLEGDRGFALIGLLRELNGSDLAKAQADAKALSRQAKGDLDIVYAWLKYGAHQGSAKNPVAYAMRCVATGAYPPSDSRRGAFQNAEGL